MPLNLDQYVSVHAAALDVRARRTELIANNLANADTPGYKARDLDFRQAMARPPAVVSPANRPDTCMACETVALCA